jgi:hypothetical protein
MAPKRKTRRAPGQGHPVFLRLPTNLFEKVEARAKAETWPINRAIINLLSSAFDLEDRRKLAVLIGDMELVLARYSTRVVEADLKDDLLRAVDALLEAKDSDLLARIERLRVVRAGMLKAK